MPYSSIASPGSSIAVPGSGIAGLAAALRALAAALQCQVAARTAAWQGLVAALQGQAVTGTGSCKRKQWQGHAASAKCERTARVWNIKMLLRHLIEANVEQVVVH